jgi:hypothetical protein
MPAAVTTISRLGRSVLTLCIRPLTPALDANESKERPHARASYFNILCRCF